MTGLVSWPTPQDYGEAVQKPLLNLNDPDFRDGKVEAAITGTSAIVYRIRSQNGVCAVRCFLNSVTDQKERYAAIGAHLESAKPAYMAAFQFLEKGIRVNREWYPILKMEWVEGQSLRHYIEENLGNATALAALADRWIVMLRALRNKNIAHGDLEAGNVLMKGSHFRLVDYDGMFVPALDGHRAHDLGHRHYQHPARSENDFGVHLDNFSGWVIYLTLLALSVQPGLWGEFATGEEHLLFRSEDFENPSSSSLLRSMAQISDERIQKYLPLFCSFLEMAPSAVPSAVDAVGLKPKKTEVSRLAKQESSVPEVQLDLFALSPSAAVTPPPREEIPEALKPSIGAEIFHFTHSCVRERVIIAFYAAFILTILTLTVTGTIPMTRSFLILLAGFGCIVASLTCSYVSLREVRGKLQLYFTLECRRGLAEIVRRSLIACGRFITWLDGKEVRDAQWLALRTNDCMKREKRRIGEVKSTLDAFIDELNERRAGLSQAELEETSDVLHTLQIQHNALLQEGAFLMHAPAHRLQRRELKPLRSWRVRVEELARKGPPIVLPEDEQERIRQKYQIERRAVQESERFALQATARKIESIHAATKRYCRWIELAREHEHIWFERLKQLLKGQIENGKSWLDANRCEMKHCIAEIERYREICLSRYLPRLFDFFPKI